MSDSSLPIASPCAKLQTTKQHPSRALVKYGTLDGSAGSDAIDLPSTHCFVESNLMIILLRNVHHTDEKPIVVL